MCFVCSLAANKQTTRSKSQDFSFHREFQNPISLSYLASLVAQMGKNLSTMQETQVRSLGREDALGKETATHSSLLAWRIPWTEQPGGLQSRGSQRAGHDWVTNTHISYLAASRNQQSPVLMEQTLDTFKSFPRSSRFSSTSQKWRKGFSSWLSFPSAELGITLKTSHIYSLEKHEEPPVYLFLCECLLSHPPSQGILCAVLIN